MQTAADLIHTKKEQFILNSIGKFEGRVIAMQENLLDLLLNEFVSKFDVKDGYLTDTPVNYQLLNELDKVMDKFYSSFQLDVLAGFATDLSESAVLSSEYYVALGFNETVVNGIRKNKIKLEEKLGLTPKGSLKKGSYLERLGQTPEVRQKLAQYVVNGLTTEMPYEEYLRGFRNMIKGTRGKVPNGFDGVLQSYYDQYAYDSFNQLDASVNKQYADNLNLKHFLYAGSLIKTSRQFCVKRAGKVFTVKEAKKWKDDPTLPVSKNYPRSTYSPLVERGRWRCRHFIKYITKALYLELVKNN